jgi:ABC-2 type transport system ATP-binding protein
MSVSNDDTPMVEVRELRKDYGATRAVADISMSIARGQVVGFLGPNGAGKSTTMKMITGFLRPSRGHAFVAGIAVGEQPLEAQRHIGYLPESAPLYDDMMVLDFLEYIADLRGVALADRRKRLKNIAERCGLMDVLGKDIGQLSKGYRQRVGLAQALVHDPDLLVLDEPTSGLDPNQIVEIRELIKDLGRDKTVLLSTHILPEVHATCGRIIIISEGKIVADDTPDRLTETEAGGVVSVLLKARNGTPVNPGRVIDLFGNLPGVRDVALANGEGVGTFGFRLRTGGDQDPRESIFGAAVSNDLVLLGMARERVSLEETFRKLTRKEEVRSA